MLQRNNAVLIYCTDTRRVVWANQAAADIWQLNEASLLCELPDSALQPIHDAANTQQAAEYNGVHFDLCVLNSTMLVYSARDAAPEHPAPVPHKVLDHNTLCSLFDRTGLLLERSSLAELLLDSGDNSFADHFVDSQEGQQIWDQIEVADYFEGPCLVRTTQGERWHLIQAGKVQRASSSWQVRVQEIDIDAFVRTETQLRATLREQQVIFEHAGTGICYTKVVPGGYRQIMRCNQKFAEIYGYEIGELIGQGSAMLYPDQTEYRRVGETAYPQLEDGSVYTHRLRMRRKDGTLFWADIRGKIIASHEPGNGYIWIIEDINDYIESNRALQSLLHEQQLILDHAMVGIVFLKNRRVTRCNRRFEEIFGYDEGELQDSSSRQWYLTESDWEAAGRACYEPLSSGKVFKGEMLLSRKDGTPIWCDVSSQAIDPHNLSLGSIWITMDISERKAADDAIAQARQELEQRVEVRTLALKQAVESLNQEINERRVAEERIKHMALHDALTGLPNRVLLEERLELALSQAARQDTQVAVLFIDLDRFKHINDSLGHHEGDQLLIEVSNRLHNTVRNNDTVARLGGDEFVIVLSDIRELSNVHRVLEKLRSSFSREIRLALQEVFITPSIGIALYPGDGQTPVELMRHADAAMYHAKEQGRNRAQFFNRDLDASLKERLALEHALRQAIKLQQFQLYYQPQVDVANNRIMGAEALIRWNHPEKGVISPAAFIPLAEETGMILELGQWVLTEACRQLKQWQRTSHEHFTLSVNLSAIQVQQPDFVHRLRDTLKETGAEPSLLDIELTESMIMRNAESTIETLDTLHGLGLKISVDDFGTGYSSLSYLKRFALDTLKIDRSFVQDITVNADDAMICRTIISMAQNLNMQVVAEGVETEAQLQLLKQYGCELYQGYLFSRPVPTEQFNQLLADERRCVTLS